MKPQNNLNQLIHNSGLKKKYIAEKLGISDIYLSMILSGNRKATKIKIKLEQYLLKNKKKSSIINVQCSMNNVQ